MDLHESVGRIRFLIRHGEILFPPELEHVVSDAGITTVPSAVRAPLMNAIMERWIGERRCELLDRAVLGNLPYLRSILRDYEAHHNTHGPHMALAGAAPDKPRPSEVVDLNAFRVRRQDRVGEVIREIHRAAWPSVQRYRQARHRGRSRRPWRGRRVMRQAWCVASPAATAG